MSYVSIWGANMTSSSGLLLVCLAAILSGVSARLPLVIKRGECPVTGTQPNFDLSRVSFCVINFEINAFVFALRKWTRAISIYIVELFDDILCLEITKQGICHIILA